MSERWAVFLASIVLPASGAISGEFIFERAPFPGGRLRMFVRATQRIGRICCADSTDGGLSWTPAQPTILPHPNSGIQAVALRDGPIILVYNHTQKGRSPLNVAVSSDGEDTWKSRCRTSQNEIWKGTLV
jgi:predicted neuraminidase